MKLCVTSHKPVWRSPDAASGFATDGGFPFQMAAVSSLFTETELLVCERPAPREGLATPLPAERVRVVPLREPQGNDAVRKLFLAGSAPYYLARMARHVARADVVHAVVPGDVGMLGMLLAHAMRKRQFVRYCSSWPNTPQTTRASRLCKQWMVRHAGGRNVMFATGLENTPPDGSAGRVHWIFSTSLSAADLETLEKKTVRRQVVSDRCRILYLGRLSSEKGVLDLLEAFARLETSPVQCQLTLAGHGPQIGALRERIAALGLGQRVRFTGLLDRTGVYEELAAADLFVQPSLTESFPKALLEALAAGLPAVATRVGSTATLLGVDGTLGHLVPPGDPVALAAAIGALVTDPQRRVIMGVQARQRARNWTLEAWAAQIGAILEEAWELSLKGSLDDRPATAVHPQV